MWLLWQYIALCMFKINILQTGKSLYWGMFGAATSIIILTLLIEIVLIKKKNKIISEIEKEVGEVKWIKKMKSFGYIAISKDGSLYFLDKQSSELILLR